MSENQPRYYSIFYKNGRPKPKEPPKERKRKLKTSNKAEKQVKVELVPEVSEVMPKDDDKLIPDSEKDTDKSLPPLGPPLIPEILENPEITPMETEEDPCNWDNLPNELKVKCIEKTDFKTRANLTLSNRHNKMLVESIKSKHQLSYVYFKASRWFDEHCHEHFDFGVKSWRSTADFTSNEYEPKKFMDVLLNANIDELEFKCAEFIETMDKILPDALAKCNKKFSVKSLHLIATHGLDLNILKLCDEQLEQITLICVHRPYTYHFEMLLRIPQVIASKRLTIILLWAFDPHDNLKTVINWLLVKVDHDIGKEIIVQYDEEPSWQLLVRVTKTRRDFHHPTEKIICLRTKNPSKRVWAWHSEDDESYNFLVVADGSDAPNIEEIEKKRAKEREEYLLKTRL